MTLVILDPYLVRDLKRQRRRRGIDGPDEVWDGCYVVFAPQDIQHQELRGDLAVAIGQVVRPPGSCFLGVNVSDRRTGWMKNFRVPDVAVVLENSTAADCGTHFYGGPDFAIEIVSPRDRTRKKLPFYEKVGTRELLVVDRRPWRLSLFRLVDGELTEVGQSTIAAGQSLASQVVPLTFRMAGEAKKPAIEITHHDGRQRWFVEARSMPPQA